MLLAVTYPERTERIVVVDMAPKYYPVHHKVILDALSTLDFTQIKTREQADQQLGKFIIEPSIRQFLLKNVYRKTSDELGLRINLSVVVNTKSYLLNSLKQKETWIFFCVKRST